MPMTTAATQPSASAPRLGISPTCKRGTARHPMSTVADVTGCRSRPPGTHRVGLGYPRTMWVRHDRGRNKRQIPSLLKGRKLTTEFARHDLAKTPSSATEPDRVRVIREGVASYLPDIDPEETSEWVESFDG